MNSSPLQLDRLEFLNVDVEANLAYDGSAHPVFPQLDFDFSRDVVIARKHSLSWHEEGSDDPRFFVLSFGVRLKNEEGRSVMLPYDATVEARAFLRYLGDEFSGKDRFRAIRASGYPMLYVAIRELVATITARSAHGLWQLPALNFHRMAEREADQDFARWEKERKGPTAGTAKLKRRKADAVTVDAAAVESVKRRPAPRKVTALSAEPEQSIPVAKRRAQPSARPTVKATKA